MNKLKLVIFTVKLYSLIIKIYISVLHIYTHKIPYAKITIKPERDVCYWRYISEAEARVNEREQLFVLSRNAHYYKRNSRLICISG